MKMIGIIKQNSKKSVFRVGVTFFLLCVVLSIASVTISGANDTPTPTSTVATATPEVDVTPALTSRPVHINTSTVNITTKTPLIPKGDAWIAIALLVIVFGLLVALGYRAKERGRLDMGEMRRAIAGTFVVGFTILTILCLTYGIYQTEIIIAYVELVGIVIGFYFGTRTAAEKRAEAAVKISIEHVKFLKKKFAITIRNGGDSEIKVDKIYIGEEAFAREDIKIDPQKSKEIEQDYTWKDDTEYKIKIATAAGLTADITVKTPKPQETSG